MTTNKNMELPDNYDYETIIDMCKTILAKV